MPLRFSLLPASAILILACGSAGPSEAQLPIGIFTYDRTAPLAMEMVPQPSQGPIALYQVSFDSPGGGRVTGSLAIPNAVGRRPAVLLMHGLPGTAQGALNLMGLELAARGAVVLAIDAPWARRGGLPDFTSRDSVEQVQLINDMQRAIDVLIAREDVDPTRIGYVGGSYGGAMGALFVGVERRLRAANLFVPDGGLVAHFTNASGQALGPLANLGSDAQQRWLTAMRPIEPILFVGHSTPTPLLIQNGRTDPLVTVEDAEALHAAAGSPKEVIWYDAGHNLATFAAAKADRARFLEQHLGIPLPTPG
jgi:dienelactone hydrolase